MSTAEKTGNTIDRELLHELFCVPEEDGPSRLVLAARREHYTLPYLVLSVLEAEGVELGVTAAGELARARRRADHYADLVDRVLAGIDVEVLKGRGLAARYPSGVLRAQGDLDLVVRDEAELWRAAEALTADPVLSASVSLFGAPRRDLVVTLCWVPEEPLVDPEVRVELLTAPLLGDQGAVPVRANLPDDPVLADLMCVAEEGLQRRYHRRDALDLHVLVGAAPLDAADVRAAAAEFHLAPELVALVEYTADLLRVPEAIAWLPVLRPEAERESERRAEHPVPPPVSTTTAALAAGRLLHGMPLGGAPSLTGEDVLLHTYGDEVLALTPIGDYLLVSGAIVSRDRFYAALAERGGLGRNAG